MSWTRCRADIRQTGWDHDAERAPTGRADEPEEGNARLADPEDDPDGPGDRAGSGKRRGGRPGPDRGDQRTRDDPPRRPAAKRVRPALTIESRSAGTGI